MRVQSGWPVGKPLCRTLGRGPWEFRTDLPNRRTSRVLFQMHDGKLIVLHAWIKKTRKSPLPDVNLARKRMKEVIQ